MTQNIMQDELTTRQELFCREYIIDFNGTRSALAAGYSEKSCRQAASDTLSKPYIRHRINELLAERSQRTNVTADYVLSTIVETIERCKGGQRVYERDGRPVIAQYQGNEIAAVYEYNVAGVLKGCELLAKHLGMTGERAAGAMPNGVQAHGEHDAPFTGIAVRYVTPEQIAEERAAKALIAAKEENELIAITGPEHPTVQ